MFRLLVVVVALHLSYACFYIPPPPPPTPPPGGCGFPDGPEVEICYEFGPDENVTNWRARAHIPHGGDCRIEVSSTAEAGMDRINETASQGCIGKYTEFECECDDPETGEPHGFVTSVCLYCSFGSTFNFVRCGGGPCGDPTQGVVRGDPHFTGLLGQKFHFDGEHHHVYNIISDTQFQMNVKYIEITRGQSEITGQGRITQASEFRECSDMCVDSDCVAWTFYPETSECKLMYEVEDVDYLELINSKTSIAGINHKEFVSLEHKIYGGSFLGDIGIQFCSEKFAFLTNGNVYRNDELLPDGRYELPESMGWVTINEGHYRVRVPHYDINIELLEGNRIHHNIEVQHRGQANHKQQDQYPNGILGQTLIPGLCGEDDNKGCREGLEEKYNIPSGDIFGDDFELNLYEG